MCQCSIRPRWGLRSGDQGRSRDSKTQRSPRNINGGENFLAVLGTRKIGSNKYEKWSIGLIGKTIDFYYLLKNNSIAEILSQIMNERYFGMINNYSATPHQSRLGERKENKSCGNFCFIRHIMYIVHHQ